MTHSQFIAELETILEIEAGTLKGDENLADLPTWDSMAVLSFIAMADSKLEQVV